jgi:hypothetical protein
MCPVSLGFRTPLDPIVIWRYMPLSKFKTFVQSSALWFAAASSFPDRTKAAAEASARDRLWDRLGVSEEQRETIRGLTDVLESPGHLVPMVAIPIGYDQPGVAARIAHHGTGEFTELDELTTERIWGLIEKVLQDPSYRERAEYFQKVISKTRGLDVAADIIEQAFKNIRRRCRVTAVLLHEVTLAHILLCGYHTKCI